MDRSVFLSALTFLEESVSSEWPPGDAEHCDVLLKDHVVSMEPASTNSSAESTIGPAFFVPSLSDTVNESFSDFDPSICPIQVAVVKLVASKEEKQAASPHISSAFSTLSHGITSPRTPAIKRSSPKTPTKKTTETTHLYFYIDKQRVFRVDTRRLIHVEVLSGIVKTTAASNDTKNASSPRPKCLPPCLMFYFDSCCFRIFSMSACDKADTADDQKVLQGALQRLQTVPRGKEAPAIQSDSSSPTSSSAPSSMEPGQKEPFGVLEKSDSQHSSSSNLVHETKSTVCAQVKRRHKSLENSWQGLMSLQDLLETPGSSLAISLQNGESLGDVLSPILTSAAQDLAESRQLPTKAESKHGTLAKLSSEMEQHKADLDKVLNAAFPPPSKKRRRYGATATPNRSNLDLNDLKERARQLLERQRQVVETRHGLAMLP